MNVAGVVELVPQYTSAHAGLQNAMPVGVAGESTAATMEERLLLFSQGLHLIAPPPPPPPLEEEAVPSSSSSWAFVALDVGDVNYAAQLAEVTASAEVWGPTRLLNHAWIDSSDERLMELAFPLPPGATATATPALLLLDGSGNFAHAADLLPYETDNLQSTINYYAEDFFAYLERKREQSPDTVEKDADGITIINDMNFNTATAASETTVFVLKFFVPWCKFCQEFEPVFASAARDFAQQYPAVDVVWASVDVSEEEALRGLFGIQQYPTLKILYGGSKPRDAFDFHSDHTAGAASIVSYVAAKSPSPVKPLGDVERANELVQQQIERGNSLVVSFFGVDDNCPAREFFDAAMQFGGADAVFCSAVASPEAIAEALRVNSVPLPACAIVVKFAGRDATLIELPTEGEEGLLHRGRLHQSIALNALPLVVEFIQTDFIQAAWMSAAGILRMGFILVDPKAASASPAATRRLMLAAEDLMVQHRETVQLLWSDYDQASLSRMLHDNELTEADLPACVLLSLDEGDELFPFGPVAASLLDAAGNLDTSLLGRFLGDVLPIVGPTRGEEL